MGYYFIPEYPRRERSVDRLVIGGRTIASSEQEAASTLVLTPESAARCLLSLTQALGRKRHMQLLLIISVISGIAFLVVWRPCVTAVQRSQRPSFLLPVIGGLVAGIAMVGILEGHSVASGDWGIPEWWFMRAILTFLFSFLVGAAASLVVVATYRRRTAP